MSYTALRQTLVDSLRTTHKIEEDDVAKILPENEDQFDPSSFKERILELDSERIDKINQRGSEKMEQGYKKGTKEAMSKHEAKIREEFNIDDDNLMGIDLVKKVVELNAEKSKGDTSKLSDEDLRSHPSVIKLLNEKDKSFQDREKEIKEDYESKLNNFQKERVFNKVSKKALSILDGLNPVLSSDPDRATNQKNILINALDGIPFQEDGDEFIPLDENGKRLEDKHGHGISFENLVKSKAEKYYDFKKADDRSNPDPNGDEPDGTLPKTEEEYVRRQSDQSIPLEDRLKMKEEWNKKQQSQS